MERNPWFRALIVLLVIIATLYLFGVVWATMAMFGDIIMLFFLAWLVAFVLSPLVNFLVTKCALPRPLAVASIYTSLLIMLIVAGIVIVPLIGFQLAQFGASLPNFIKAAPGLVNQLQNGLQSRGLNVHLDQWYQAQNFPAQIQNMAALAIQNVLSVVTSVASTLFAVVVIIILSLYMALDGDRLADEAIILVPKEYQGEIRYLLASIDRSFGGFLRSQLIQAVVYAAGTGLIMWVISLNYILLAMTFSGIVMIIPFFGPFLALVPPLLIAAFQASPGQIIFLIVALLVLQQLVLNVLVPKLMGNSLGIHPLLVFLAILVGGKTAGLAGALFGVPIVGVINAMVLYFIRKSPSYAQWQDNQAMAARARQLESHYGWRQRLAQLQGTLGKFIAKSG